MDFICHLLMRAIMSNNQTALHEMTREYINQQATISMNLSPPAHKQVFILIISPTVLCFHFIDHTIGIAFLWLGMCFKETTFQCLQSMWSCYSLYITLINSGRLGCCKASSKVIVPGSEALATLVEI